MLRHSKQEQQMCRKLPGVDIGYVCQQHEGRCVICDLQFDEVLPTMREVRICSDCGFGREGDERCVMCNASKPTEVAYYCQYCVALEKDRDGCPRVLNQSRHQRIATVRTR
ncbi:PHF5-like protein, putative [Trypanosoma equiperdum]|uniref:PHD finger-like domain-containing protein 5A n=4 Tax=Trypanozoon TaxID=39700 RepID=Q38AM4_TRYB2|nr:hypothetical protein, conserved [Trypanosoma brucei gambiense DAL972]XP_822974.1 hypothetical protein, conserved [Trypanosoma brucei brucei TREU927]RHW69462.1 PHF5-like protein [Trypanosoma brucei equiperdum]SCU72605.1 PHF5-like protein, putative [Trypanosoma equiperdum]EAN78146.1 hypothetical protein, conserved [Trypanosoma brucei brucei TREU927]CBH15815.1 hypothetical protein, conserved [Trypanosoma brucei gambiense DAL972]|eukprot:XP_011778079.1 hypothetical protein, conserved [Trypanosoma brucei gambiense DAL972]